MGSADQRGITLWACITILSGNIIPIYISSDLKIFGLDKKGRRSTWVNIGTKCAATGAEQNPCIQPTEPGALAATQPSQLIARSPIGNLQANAQPYHDQMSVNARRFVWLISLLNPILG